MRSSLLKLTVLSLLVASAPVWAEESGAVDNGLAKADHAVGKEKWDLKVMERDSKLGKPVKELGKDGDNRVERATKYYSNGKMEKQETKEYVGTSDTLNYDEKNEFSKSGKATFEFRQTSTFTNGAQTGGDGWEKEYNRGKVTKETKRRWTVDAKDWKDYYVQTTGYYGNGDLKEQTTEDMDANKKARDTWGTRKADGGRNKTTKTWNGEAKRWD
jgi:hypothetical protein